MSHYAGFPKSPRRNKENVISRQLFPNEINSIFATEQLFRFGNAARDASYRH